MASPSTLLSLWWPGTLIINPTDGDLTGTYPFGGTILGECIDGYLKIDRREYEITAEEYGGEAVDVCYLGDQWSYACAIRGRDPDAINLAFENTSKSNSEHNRQVNWPLSSGVVEGALDSDREVKLVFYPKDYARHPTFYARAAMPTRVKTLSVATRRDQEATIGIVFRAKRDATTENNSVQLRDARKITL